MFSSALFPLLLNCTARQKILQGKAQAGGQKGRGSGGNEFLPVRAEIVAQKRFELRSAIATNLFSLQ